MYYADGTLYGKAFLLNYTWSTLDQINLAATSYKSRHEKTKLHYSFISPASIK